MSIIVAIDKHAEDDVLRLVDTLDPELCKVKVGKELFTALGPRIVQLLQRRQFDVFLDLKFHDIPNTTAQAVVQAADLGVWMVNVHALGGSAMMCEAVKRLQAGGYETQLIAVTVLTSMGANDLHELGILKTPDEMALHLATLAYDCGLHGVVCSAQEASAMRQRLGVDFVLVTPGIRPQGANVDDQTRIMTPEQAMQAGSSHLVIGRPITGSADPVRVLRDISYSISTY